VVGGLAVVRTLGAPRKLATQAESEDFEQELVDQWSLAIAGAGATDGYVRQQRGAIVEFLRFVNRPLWTVLPDDADRWLKSMRVTDGRRPATVADKAGAIARFYAFLIVRYQGDIHALTGAVLSQPIDEFNRPSKVVDHGATRVPPADQEVDALFAAWRQSLPEARKYLPAARDYLAASLWRRAGLRINETAMLDIRDWRPDLGTVGKLHVRFGKGSGGRGPKVRLVPGINAVDELMTWWLTDVRHQFNDDWDNPEAPMLPSERRDPDTGRVLRAGADALRTGFAQAVTRWLPDWNTPQRRLTPHGMRHYCASSLYAQGVGLKAIQELLGHSWLSTTTLYVHVHDNHIEQAWNQANQRVTDRLLGKGGTAIR
jgi:site-specific recombinase XerD